MLALLIQTLNITAPVFAMLFMGVLLKRIRLIDDNFNRVASQLVFNVCMPALLFLGIYHADLATAVKPGVLLYFVVATLAGFAIAWGLAIWRSPLADRGIYTQGAFRGNNGVIGLALAASLYGDYGISLAARYPERAKWWADMEAKQALTDRPTTFRQDRPTYAEMLFIR